MAVEAPVDANVWKVRVREGGSKVEDSADEEEQTKKETVNVGDDVVILEAMKLEVAVQYGVDRDGEKIADTKASAKVAKVLVKSGETVKAGQNLCLLRPAS